MCDGKNHSICGECWINRVLVEDRADRVVRNQAGDPIAIALPVRARDAVKEQCCFCGRPTKFGAFIRTDPKVEQLTFCTA